MENSHPGRRLVLAHRVERQVFLTSATENGTKCHVLCVDAKSGTILWDKHVFDQQPRRKEGKNSYATPTPATDGKQRLCCVRRWQRRGAHDERRSSCGLIVRCSSIQPPRSWGVADSLRRLAHHALRREQSSHRCRQLAEGGRQRKNRLANPVGQGARRRTRHEDGQTRLDWQARPVSHRTRHTDHCER